jgi:hypothetical protein
MKGFCRPDQVKPDEHIGPAIRKPLPQKLQVSHIPNTDTQFGHSARLHRASFHVHGRLRNGRIGGRMLLRRAN